MELTRDQLLAAAATQALPRERVDISELGGYVYVRAMTGKERDEWEHSLMFVTRRGRVEQRVQNVRARLAVRCLVNEAGERLFKDEDAEVLGNLRSDVLSLIYEKAQRLSGVSDEDIDELKKFSAAPAGTASPSSSPSS